MGDLKETKKFDNRDMLHNIANGFSEWIDYVSEEGKGKNKVIREICRRIIELERKMGL